MQKLIQGDCLEIMTGLEDNSVDLILTDPPYYKVKSEEWDNQWNNQKEFLEWLGSIAEQWQRILKHNGSLYCFASPQMAARVEVLLSDRFNVLNHIVWAKTSGWWKASCKESLRMFFPSSERIIFSEQYGADNDSITKHDKLKGFIFDPLRKYFVDEKKRCGITSKEIQDGMKLLTGKRWVFDRHTFSTSQWCLPVKEQYEAARILFNAKGGEYLQKDYKELQKDYKELQKDYEELRRKFSVTVDVPYTDVWHFDTVQTYKGKHPCEKPLDLLKHIISSSSRVGDVVLDCFAGSCNTGIAAESLVRDSILIEKDDGYFKIAEQRIKKAYPKINCKKIFDSSTGGPEQLRMF